MIVLEWADIIQSFRQPTTLAMDSYYLDNNGRQRLLERGVRYVAALKPDRFASIAQLLSPGVRQQGDTTWAWNGERREAAVHHWSRETGVGKKFALSNCFTLTRQRNLPHKIPIYDHYKAMFSGCDAFNQQMHNRTFPYALPRDTAQAISRNIWNYLFTSTVLNCWNAWRSVLQSRDVECQLPSYVDFCNSLALDIIEKLCH